MQDLTFYTLDVFTDHPFGGNQLAVFPEAPALSSEVMHAIAREFNLSETVFVRPAEVSGALRKLRIFTPGGELPFAGHPTIGTAQLLAELGVATIPEEGCASFSLEENVGLVPVEVTRLPEARYFTWLTAARLPETQHDVPAHDDLAAMLGLVPEEILHDERDAAVFSSVGLPFLFVPLRDRAALAKAAVDGAWWRELLGGAWARDVYAFCHEPESSLAHVRARMFGPSVGIIEDPATGSAAAALAGYLWKRSGGPGRWIIAQGVEMGRPSTLHVEAIGAGGQLQMVRVGGSAVRVTHGALQLPAQRQ